MLHLLQETTISELIYLCTSVKQITTGSSLRISFNNDDELIIKALYYGNCYCFRDRHNAAISIYNFSDLADFIWGKVFIEIYIALCWYNMAVKK